MSRRRQKKRAAEEPTINMTPLIDVVFVILIVFIVIAPLLEVDRIELAGSDETRTESEIKQSPVTIHVYADNSLKLNERPVLLPKLKTLLSSAKKSHPGVRPQVFHDKRAAFGTYQSVKTAVEAAGFEEMDIVLLPGSS